MSLFSSKKKSVSNTKNRNENRSIMGNSGLSAQGDGNAISVTNISTDGRAITEMGELARKVVSAEERKAMASGKRHKEIRTRELTTLENVFEKSLEFSRRTTADAVGAIAEFGRPDAGAGEAQSRNTMIFAAVVVVAFIAMMMFRRA